MASRPEDIRMEEYTYDLPVERIAKYPLQERDSSKLLVWNGRSISDRVFRELPEIIDRNNLMVFNNTKVIRARLLFRKESGATIEVFCLEPHQPSDFALNLGSSGSVEWKCLIGNLKRWKHGVLSSRFAHHSSQGTLFAEKTDAEGDAFIIRFSWDDNDISFGEILEALGHMPIPPYLRRNDEESDVKTYQTVYASIDGSVAAPTAGLHFTPVVLNALSQKGVDRTEITLHVSAGTFIPVKAEFICDHLMHTEHFFITKETLMKLKGQRIIAVGTTTVRTLESIYWLGVKYATDCLSDKCIASVSQWEPYDHDSQMDMDTAIDCLITLMDKNGLDRLEASTDIIIIPGYRFRLVSSMVTNFHQPGSTLLLLVAAFTGDAWKDIYSHALSSGYRFLSYGDSMFLMP
jgi:S-adenosylmethionine:tRNA ribosyltransferase-isomerase